MIREARSILSSSNDLLPVDGAADSNSNSKDPMQSARLHEYEMAQLGNLLPETVEEALVVIPSLARSSVDPAQLQSILDSLQSARNFEY